jgi:predicted membrane channel-forming protein YqfA (hemolysin III family)
MQVAVAALDNTAAVLAVLAVVVLVKQAVVLQTPVAVVVVLTYLQAVIAVVLVLWLFVTPIRSRLQQVLPVAQQLQSQEDTEFTNLHLPEVSHFKEVK